MNSLIKKVMPLILVLILTAAVFSGCGAEGTKAIAAPIHNPGGHTLQNGAVQLLDADGSTPEATEPEATEPEVTEPEVTEPEATEPEVTEPEATEPEAPAENDFLQTFWARFLEFFDWFRIRVNYFFEVLMEEA